MKILDVQHPGVALAGTTAVRVLVEGTGFLTVGDTRRFVRRRFDGFVAVAAAPVIRVVARGVGSDARELRLVVVAPAPARVSAPPARVAVPAARVAARARLPRWRVALGALVRKPFSFAVDLGEEHR